MLRGRRGARAVVVRTFPDSRPRRLLDLIADSPGIGLDALVETTGYPRKSIQRTVWRYGRAGAVSSDEIDGEPVYWLERRYEPTVIEIVRARLAIGPATSRECREAVEHAKGHAYRATHQALVVMEQRGEVRVEERWQVVPGRGRGSSGPPAMRRAPSLYHATSGPTIVAGGKGSPG